MDNIPEPQSKYSTGKAYFSFICVSGWTNQNLLPDTTDPLCDGSLLHLLTLRWSLGQILGFESTFNCICDPQGHINHWHEGCWITFRRERCLKIECTWATVPEAHKTRTIVWFWFCVWTHWIYSHRIRSVKNSCYIGVQSKKSVPIDVVHPE